MVAVTLLVLMYLVCSILTYGITFGYFQREYGEIAEQDVGKDASFAFFFGLFGPMGLLMSFLLSGFCKHGFKYRWED